MDEREAFDAQQEAKRETLGAAGKSARERLWEGLTRYLSTEAAQARKAARRESGRDQRRRGS